MTACFFLAMDEVSIYSESVFKFIQLKKDKISVIEAKFNDSELTYLDFIAR